MKVTESVMLTDFREDRVLHVQLINPSETASMADALAERIEDFSEEILDRWHAIAPRFRFLSRRRKPRPVLLFDLGDTIVAHSDDVLIAYDRDVPSLLDVFIRSPAGIIAAQQTLRDLVDRCFV